MGTSGEVPDSQIEALSIAVVDLCEAVAAKRFKKLGELLKNEAFKHLKPNEKLKQVITTMTDGRIITEDVH